jgi:hypothetical protein
LRNGLVLLNPSRLEPIAKMWIRVQGKARFGEKAQHTLVCEHFEPNRSAAMGT